MADNPPRPSASSFGQNIWVVDEVYQRYLESPESVSAAWQEFFADYQPASAIPAPPAVAPALPPAGTPAMPRTEPAPLPPEIADNAVVTPMVGALATIARRMDESRDIPTATSVRSVPAKLLEVNRRILNNQLGRLTAGGKVSFTHLIGWAVVKALSERPAMNAAYRDVEGSPHAVRYRHVNLGLAVDVPRRDGTRTLLVPNIKAADQMDFRTFWMSYEDVIQRIRSGKITPEDFAGTTATITNPGTIGTVQSVPRLMPGQGVIVGVGSIDFPPEYQGADELTIARLGIGRVVNLTSTYDHRVIQGAESGEFLKRMAEFLLGEDGFYDQIFAAMSIPYVPARWAKDDNPPWGSDAWAEKQARVFQIINLYRVRGHLIADLDPLRMTSPSIHDELDPLSYGLTLWDLDRRFPVGGLGGHGHLLLGEALGLLRDAYCRTVGIEYMHIQITQQKRWIQQRVEHPPRPFSRDEKIRILRKLNEAEAFERFLHTKYVGHKRFGLEGSESLIPALDALLNEAVAAGMGEVVIGMAHRGRLNVLANIIGKSYERIFREFEGGLDPDARQGSGDVKYHLGASGTHTSPEGTSILVEVVSNPSHLEAVDPVLEGIVRAKQDLLPDGDLEPRDRVLPLLIHGDAAFSGQGVVGETLNLSQLEGYHTGGTVHVVVNNQVGFTTDAADARSSVYATDVAKAVQAPIFHVNGDDPEAVVRVARMAFDFRQAFHKDVVVDIVCYRRHGHNEADEPSFTQPVMYRAIETHRSVRKLYLEHLVNRGEITLDEGEQLLEEFQAILHQALAETRDMSPPRAAVAPSGRRERPTGVSREALDRIETALRAVPEGFSAHPKVARVLEERGRLYAGGQVDWASAEALAFGSLAVEGNPVRLAGEDSRRGTFSQRHATLVDGSTGLEWMPLAHLAPEQGRVEIVDSLLSEFAALGFEYGYSVIASDTLVAWEAQFGDFSNGAQVVIDQFVLAGEDKWNQRSGLVMMLPHGFEGQGPEHSSARLERFLIGTAGDNIRVVVPSTAGSYFHALRRQVRAEALKPLVLFTPKSLLRTRESFSPLSELTDGGFRPVLDDPGSSGVRRVVLCSGKVFYDLETGRRERHDTSVGLVRLEQLYPFPEDEIRASIERQGPGVEVVWLQEEPENMGAWLFVAPRLRRLLGREVGLIARTESASPATGSYRVHIEEQRQLVDKAFA